MPEAKKYKCVNIGTLSYPVWLLLGDKTAIVSIAPCDYDQVVSGPNGKMILKTTVSLAQSGCVVEVSTPVAVAKVMEILGVTYTVEPGEDAEPEAAQPELPKAAQPELKETLGAQSAGGGAS